QPKELVNPQKLYEMSGLAMVLKNVGIVEAYRILLSNRVNNATSEIQDVLGRFSSTILRKVIDRTVSLGPYSPNIMIDFVAIAKPWLDFQGIKAYNNLDYRKYFLGDQKK
ncbi:hypothetical protein LCGC14_1585070, partial [marine sediment metagenome]